MIIGDPQGLSFDLQWAELGDDLSAEGHSWAHLRVFVHGEHVWLKGNGIQWTMTDLLAHFAWNWPWLVWQEGLPHGETADLAKVARDQVLPPDDLSVAELDSWQDAWWDFAQVHDLSNALQGIFVPSFWLVRRGLEFELATKSERWFLAAPGVLGAIEELCTAIADRIRPASDAVGQSLTAKWAERHLVEIEKQERLLTGLGEGYLAELEPTASKRLALLGIEQSPGPNPYCAIARMAGPIADPVTLRELLKQVAGLAAVDKAALERISAAAAVPYDPCRRPHQTGILLAVRTRAALELTADQPLDPADILVRLGIPIHEIHEEGNLDAVAVWSPNHGPAIILNRRSRRHQGGVHAQRATLAHELCHLVADRQRALPLGEVLGGAVSAEVEACANAFAAEFLLPQEAAAAAAQTMPAGQVVESLCRAFGVGAELAAWQVINSAAWSALSRQERSEVAQSVPDPRRRRQVIER